LVFYRASNCSKETTCNFLKKLFGIGSATNISDYCHYLENSYLCFFINRYKEGMTTMLSAVIFLTLALGFSLLLIKKTIDTLINSSKFQLNKELSCLIKP